jgi:hypothetical protein
MGLHHPFGHLKHKLWPKKRSGVELAVWLSTTKSRESTWCPCVHVVCDISLENSQRRLQLCLDLNSIGGLHTKLWGSKVAGVPTLGILRFPFGSPRTKCHLDVGLVERHKIYYKGEGGGFPQVQVVVNLVSPSLPVVHPSTKVLQLCTNHLVVGFVQVHLSSWCLSLFLVPSWSSNTPLYSPKVLRARECAPTPCTSIVFAPDSYLSLSRSLGTRHPRWLFIVEFFTSCWRGHSFVCSIPLEFAHPFIHPPKP